MTYTSAPHVLVLETPGLGDRSYIAHDGQTALVVDPQRDIDRVEHLLAEHGLRLTPRVRDPRAQRLRERRPRPGRTPRGDLRVPGDVDVAYERTAALDGDTFQVGELHVRALHTPGHTPHHISYEVRPGRAPGRGVHRRVDALRSGRTARPHRAGRHGRAGPRPVAVGAALRRRAATSTRGSTRPTASGRSAPPPRTREPAGTIEDEAKFNPALTQDEETFVERDARRSRRLPGVLRPHGPGQRGRTGRASTSRSPSPPTGGAAATYRRRRVGGRPPLARGLRQGTRPRHLVVRP